MAGNWQTAMNSRWAVLPSMTAPSGLSRSHRFAASGRPTTGWSAGWDTRSLEGRSSTAGVHCPSGVQNRVGVLPLRVCLASSLAQASEATTIWAEGSTSWSGFS